MADWLVASSLLFYSNSDAKSAYIYIYILRYLCVCVNLSNRCTSGIAWVLFMGENRLWQRNDGSWWRWATIVCSTMVTSHNARSITVIITNHASNSRTRTLCTQCFCVGRQRCDLIWQSSQLQTDRYRSPELSLSLSLSFFLTCAKAHSAS